MAEAHPEDRRRRVEQAEELHEAPGLLGPPGARGKDHPRRRPRGERLGRLGVGADDLGPVAQPLDELDQVVDEGVVVVDHEDHRTVASSNSRDASASGVAAPTAGMSAEAFASVSRSSRSGSES